jgi:spore germination protein GerM
VATMPGTIVPGMATLDIVRDDGSILGRRTLTILRQDQGQAVKVAWLKPGSEEIVMVERLVPRTPQIASAALSELLWGPAPGEPYATSLPDPAEVLAADARTPDWGPRVRLLKLTITDGVALADFGPELSAYGGGSARVGLIRGQIEATLKEFPAVREVVIAIDGRTEGVLEP